MVFVARVIPSILYVRERLLLEKGKPYSSALSNGAHLLAAVTVAVLAITGLVTTLAVPVVLFLLYRAANGLSPRRRTLKAMQIGVREIIYGALLVLAIVFGQICGV